MEIQWSEARKNRTAPHSPSNISYSTSKMLEFNKRISNDVQSVRTLQAFYRTTIKLFFHIHFVCFAPEWLHFERENKKKIKNNLFKSSENHFHKKREAKRVNSNWRTPCTLTHTLPIVIFVDFYRKNMVNCFYNGKMLKSHTDWLIYFLNKIEISPVRTEPHAPIPFNVVIAPQETHILSMGLINEMWIEKTKHVIITAICCLVKYKCFPCVFWHCVSKN